MIGYLQIFDDLDAEARRMAYERFKEFDRLIVDSGDPDELAARLGIDRSQITIAGVDQSAGDRRLAEGAVT